MRSPMHLMQFTDHIRELTTQFTGHLWELRNTAGDFYIRVIATDPMAFEPKYKFPQVQTEDHLLIRLDDVNTKMRVTGARSKRVFPDIFYRDEDGLWNSMLSIDSHHGRKLLTFTPDKAKHIMVGNFWDNQGTVYLVTDLSKDNDTVEVRLIKVLMTQPGDAEVTESYHLDDWVSHYYEYIF